jgi:hypothetical protein
MRKLVWLALALTLITVSFTSVSRSDAQTSCSCPWEVKQLDCSGGYDCSLAQSNCERNVGFWANQACWNRGGACTYLSTPLGCTTNPDGTVTYSLLINYKCNQC